MQTLQNQTLNRMNLSIQIVEMIFEFLHNDYHEERQKNESNKIGGNQHQKKWDEKAAN